MALTGWKLAKWPRMAGQQTPEICSFLSLQHWDYKGMLPHLTFFFNFNVHSKNWSQNLMLLMWTHYTCSRTHVKKLDIAARICDAASTGDTETFNTLSLIGLAIREPVSINNTMAPMRQPWRLFSDFHMYGNKHACVSSLKCMHAYMHTHTYFVKCLPVFLTPLQPCPSVSVTTVKRNSGRTHLIEPRRGCNIRRGCS